MLTLAFDLTSQVSLFFFMSVTLVSVYFSMYTLYFECKCSFCVMWTNPCLKFSLRQTTSLSLFCPCPKTGLRSTS